MARRWNKIEAAMNAGVANPAGSVGALLFIQILFILIVYVLQYWIPTNIRNKSMIFLLSLPLILKFSLPICIVDTISKPGCVRHR